MLAPEGYVTTTAGRYMLGTRETYASEAQYEVRRSLILDIENEARRQGELDHNHSPNSTSRGPRCLACVSEGYGPRAATGWR